MSPQNNLSRGSLSNFCDADADADVDEDADSICRLTLYGGGGAGFGVDIIMQKFGFCLQHHKIISAPKLLNKLLDIAQKITYV